RDVRCWGNYSGHNESNQHRVPCVAQQEGATYESNARQDEDESRNLKNNGEAQLDHDEQVEVFRRADPRDEPHSDSPLDEELQRKRKCNKVAEKAAQNKQNRRRKNER